MGELIIYIQTDQTALIRYLIMDLKYWKRLLIVTALTLTGSGAVKLGATDENGKPTNHLLIGKIVNLNCTYTVDPHFLTFKNGMEKKIFSWDFSNKTGEVGEEFKKWVKSNEIGDGWVSIAFEVPYCYKDGTIKCFVLSTSRGTLEDEKVFQIGAIPDPSNINGTSCNGMITFQEPKNEFPLTCQNFGIQPEGKITWSRGCTEYESSSIEDKEKCFFNQTSTALCTAAQSTDMSVTCSVENPIGKGSCTIRIIKDSDVVKLRATDENGKSTNHLSPGKIVNLNCTYQFDPLSMSFYNGSDMTIFGWNFFTRNGSTGSGFENLVKPVGAGDRWVSIELEVPYCYKDEVIKCTVLDKVANKHKDNKTFTIRDLAAIQKPSKINGTNCNGTITLKKNDNFQLTCHVFGVKPEVNITWSDGCTEDDEVTTEDTECFFNQVSRATCTMIEGTDISVTCSAENAAGKESCTIMIQEEGLPAWVIVISVIIPLVILCVLVVLFLVWKSRKQAAKSAVNGICSTLSQHPVNITKDEEDSGYLTPITDVLDMDHPRDEDAGYVSLQPSESEHRQRPDAGYLSLIPSEPENRQRQGPVVNMETKSDILNHLPANVKKEAMKFVLEVEGLHHIKDIGKGHFGKVYLCKLIQGTHSCLVAVKSMNGGHFRKPEEVQAFIQEALKIKDFRNDCILSPLGIIFHRGTPKIILPYMENGDLRGFLTKKMSSSGAFELLKLLSFCCDVAEGMSYLSRQRFAHMDLAARNCMVDGMFRVKVGDFGMTHDLYEKSYYRMSKSKPLPVRWMAPESITENKFTCKSDVWSYGVVMWEVFTHGDQPYKHLNNHQFLNKFASGEFVRLEQPDLCPKEIYSMMCECWNPDPDGRPRFSVMKAELERISDAPIMNV